jgi:single-stranded-DNA-specific exonuclease
MSTPDIAARLLLASDATMAAEVKALAEQLDAENSRRQQEEATITAAARRIVETDPDVGAQTVLVVAGDQWHRGVIGIVASKLVEVFHRPAIVLSLEDGIAHGSCRSIPGFDMLEALETCAPMFVRFGGHTQAAGLTMESERVKEFRAAINRHADSRLGPDDLRPRLRIDAAVSFRGLNGDLAYQVTALAPFGAGNPRPLFAAAGVEIIDGPRPLKDRHLKMTLRQDGRTFRAVAWRAIERQAFLQEHRERLDFAFSLDQSMYNGDMYVELTVADARRPLD